jgi:hypothetical protein
VPILSLDRPPAMCQKTLPYRTLGHIDGESRPTRCVLEYVEGPPVEVPAGHSVTEAPSLGGRCEV